MSKSRKPAGADAPGDLMTGNGALTHEVIYTWEAPRALTLQCVRKEGQPVGYIICSNSSIAAFGTTIAAAISDYNVKHIERYEGISGKNSFILNTPSSIGGHDLPVIAYREVEIRLSEDGQTAVMEVVNGHVFAILQELEDDILDDLPLVPWCDLIGTAGDIRGRIQDEDKLVKCYAWKAADDNELYYSGIIEASK